VKLSGRVTLTLIVVLVIGILVATDQILPASSRYQAEMRLWLAARAAGIVALLLLTAAVVLGIVLSHPDQNRWKQSKRIFPWHEALWVYVLAFLGVHIVSLVVDPYAGVGIGGAFIPGLSEYRSVPVALGVMSMYSLLITALTARYARLLPSGLWLRIHRLALVVLGLAWGHAVLAGTDTTALTPLYWGVGIAVLAAATYRYWIIRERVRREARQVQPSSGQVAPVSRFPVPVRVPATVEESHVEPHPAS
jgi:predicted ferric reductase